MFEGMQGMNYDPKDDPNVLLLIEAKDSKKFTKITTNADPMVQSEQVLDNLGYVVDITKEGVILLSFYYTNANREDIIHFKKSIKFMNIETVEVNTISYDTEYTKKIHNYLKLASQYGIEDSANDINLEPFSSTKYDNFIVSTNKLISFDDELESLEDTDLDENSINVLSKFVDEYKIRDYSQMFVEGGKHYCNCGNEMDSKMLESNRAIFKDNDNGLCDECWQKLYYMVKNN